MTTSRPPIVVMVGMGRSGSTTLHYQLQRHPGAVLPFRKETFYFSFNHSRGEDWFLNLYRKALPGQVGFDISPDYWLDARALERILAFDPKTRVILGIREPVSWSLSLYNQRMDTVGRMPTFREFIERYELRVGAKVLPVTISNGEVTRMIDRCRQMFGSQLLIYDFALLARDPLRVCQAIERFVGLPPVFSAETFRNVQLNASDRRHNRLLYGIANDQRLINLMHRIVPEGVLRFARERYYLAAQRTAARSAEQRHSGADVALAEEMFGAERDAIRRWLSLAPIQLGNGQQWLTDAGEDLEGNARSSVGVSRSSVTLTREGTDR